MNLYTIVTNDEYELPVKCDLRVKEAAEFLLTNPNNLRNMVCKPRKKSPYKVIVSGKVVFNRKMYDKKYCMTHDRSKYYKEWHRKRKDKNMSGYDDYIARMCRTGKYTEQEARELAISKEVEKYYQIEGGITEEKSTYTQIGECK